MNFDNKSLGRLSAGSPPANKEGEINDDDAEFNRKQTLENARSTGNTPKIFGLNSMRLKAMN